MHSYLEWQLDIILRHCSTSKLASSVISPDLGLIQPWLSLNCYDSFTAVCEHGRRFASLVLVSAPSWSGSSTLIPQLCVTLELASGTQMEREMCSYLEWQLNVLNIDPTTLRDFQTRVQDDFAGPGPYSL